MQNDLLEIHPNSSTVEICTMPIVYDEQYDADIFFDFDPESIDPMGIFVYYMAQNEVYISDKTISCLKEILGNCSDVIGKEKYFEVIPICPGNLGIDSPVTLKDFYKVVFQNGYALCPSYLPLYLCLGDNIVYPEDTIRFATKPLMDEYLLRLDFFPKEDVFYMNPFRSTLDSLVGIRDDFVFIRPNKRQKKRFVRSNFYKKEFINAPLPNPTF